MLFPVRECLIGIPKGQLVIGRSLLLGFGCCSVAAGKQPWARVRVWGLTVGLTYGPLGSGFCRMGTAHIATSGTAPGPDQKTAAGRGTRDARRSAMFAQRALPDEDTTCQLSSHFQTPPRVVIAHRRFDCCLSRLDSEIRDSGIEVVFSSILPYRARCR